MSNKSRQPNLVYLNCQGEVIGAFAVYIINWLGIQDSNLGQLIQNQPSYR